MPAIFFFILIQKAGFHRYIFIAVPLALVLLFVYTRFETGPTDHSELSEDQEKVIEYFKEVALGFEFGGPEITRKWDRDVLVFIGGEENQTLQDELENVVDELNGLISQDDIEIIISPDSSYTNYYVYFGSGEDYEKINPYAEGYTETNFGFFFVNTNISDHIIHGSMYVDTNRPEIQNQLHLVREELTQSLGLAIDSDRYSDSIFAQDYSVDVTEYSLYDKALIRLLYHPKMSTGLESSEADFVLREIIGDVID